ncbi:MAG: YqgE/AlgH family protein [Granulosicoccaceae bacterium]|jgi:putative transcriptional regulator
MADTQSLTNHFLIAMPMLEDPNFYHSVTYICEHNEQGAMGIVINRPLDIALGDVLEHMQIAQHNPHTAGREIYLGGPVQPERGFVLHEPPGQWDAMLPVTEQIGITTSRDILMAMNDGQGPERALVALGYAGWGPGQLEQEMAENAWLSVPADTAIIFDTPIERRWQAAAANLGIDLNTLSDDVGHA